MQQRRGWRERRKSGSWARLEKQRPTRSNGRDPPVQPPRRERRTASSPCSLFPVWTQAKTARSRVSLVTVRPGGSSRAVWSLLCLRGVRVCSATPTTDDAAWQKKRGLRVAPWKARRQVVAPHGAAGRRVLVRRAVRASPKATHTPHARMTGAGDRNFALPPSDSTSVSARRVSVALVRSNCWRETKAF